MVQVHNVPLTVAPQYYTGIGAVTFAWAQLEWRIMRVIWQALSLDSKKGRTLTVGMNINALLGILRTVNKKWIPAEAAADITSFANDVKKTVNMRNAITHGIWSKPTDYDGPVMHLNYMKESDHRLLPGSEAIEPPELLGFAQTLMQLSGRADAIHRALRDALPERPPTRIVPHPPTQDQIEPEHEAPPLASEG